MPEGWFLLSLGERCDVVLEQGTVRRILHRADPEFEGSAAAARDVASVLGFPGGRPGPGVVILLESGGVWTAAGVSLLERRDKVEFMPLAPDLFESGRPPWCRGVLAGGGLWAYVVDIQAVEAADG